MHQKVYATAVLVYIIVLLLRSAYLPFSDTTRRHITSGFIFEHHLSPTQNVIISDVSVPSAVHQKVVNMKHVHYIPFSSYITLPYDPNFMMSSVTPEGTTFCCAAESILCGLEQNSIPLKENIPQEAIEQISSLAEKQGLFKNIHATKSFKE